MKKKLILSLACVLLLTGCSTTVLDNSAIKEYTYDNSNSGEKVNVKGLKVGADEELAISPTYVQIGQSPTTNNYIMRFATAVKGSIEKAIYTRTSSIFSEDNTKEVETVYKGIYANDEVYYYNGTDLTTDVSYAGQYYWACYLIEFESGNHYEVDFSLSLSIEDDEGATLNSKPRTSSLHQLLNNQKDVYKLTVEGMSFKDGSSYKYIKEGESIEGLFDIPEARGYAYKSLCEKGDISNKLVSYTTMPGKNVTLVPAYEKPFVTKDADSETSASVSTTKVGKYELGVPHPTWTATGLNSNKASRGYHSAFYNEKTGVYEVLKNFYYSEGVNANSLFITYNGELSVTKDTVITYTVQNQGSETITLKLGQTQSSTTPDNNYPTGTVTLEPGEVKEVDVKTVNHNTYMSMFKFLNNVSTPINIGVMVENKLTQVNLGQAKFADGTSSKYFYGHENINSVTALLPEVEGYKFNGYLVNGALNTITTEGTLKLETNNLVPVYDVNEYAVTMTDTIGGKYNLDSIHSKGIVGFTSNEIGATTATRRTAIYNAELGIYENARLFNRDSAVEAGYSFISYIPGVSDEQGHIKTYLIPNDGTKVVFTFENKGSEPLEFTINQVESSSNPQGNANMMKELKTVSLEPGEIKDVEMSLYRKDALLTYFKLTKASANFKLAAMIKHNI